jgi:AcrR family transcriptional regulator
MDHREHTSLKKQRGKETRARLLKAAAECFAQRGYDAASVSEICRRAEVSKGAFYYHFASKQALFLELLGSWLAGLDTQLEASRVGAATVPEEILRMAKAARPVFQMTDDYIPIFLEFFTQANRDPAVWQATIEPYRRYRAFFARLIQAGIDEGSLREVDSDTAAQVLVSLSVGLLLQALFAPAGADWAQVAQDGIQMFLEGLASKDANPVP